MQIQPSLIVEGMIEWVVLFCNSFCDYQRLLTSRETQSHMNPPDGRTGHCLWSGLLQRRVDLELRDHELITDIMWKALMNR